MKRIVISTFGSFGDIHPYIAIALELRARGHEPVFATSESYREKMDALGLELRPLRPVMPSPDQPDEIGRMVEQLMGQRDGTENIFKQILMPHIRDTYEDLDAAAADADLLLTHPLPLTGPIVAQRRKLPWVSSVLAPISFFSAYDPPVPAPMPALHKLLQLSPAFTRLFLRLANPRVDKLIAPVYQLRAELGMPRGASPLFAGQHSPTLVLALFSKVLAEPQPDWPAHTRVTGFPFYDRRDFYAERETPRELLQFLDAGPPPVIFTLGSSAIWVAKDFYRDSIAAARALGRRALLLIGHERNKLSEPLPEGIAAFEYAPYSEVLPRACAIVHQGGVGTTGQSLRAGRPALVVPHAHDQFDNAARVARLGCARVLPRPKYNAQNATRELSRLLDEPSYAT
ncbi:MAG TPA: nucleotide disphospho-sugar-binding domain-containing protein, partial [Pyrinomonadaceae bacterium]|nr:nucleotide disphospho-sugar-binding domain-containing protein [Pyrinomonadaceae bacterium]